MLGIERGRIDDWIWRAMLSSLSRASRRSAPRRTRRAAIAPRDKVSTVDPTGSRSGPDQDRAWSPRKLSNTAVTPRLMSPTRNVLKSRLGGHLRRNSRVKATTMNAIAIRLLGVRAASGRRSKASAETAPTANAAMERADQPRGRRHGGKVARRNKRKGGPQVQRGWKAASCRCGLSSNRAKTRSVNRKTGEPTAFWLYLSSSLTYMMPLP